MRSQTVSAIVAVAALVAATLPASAQTYNAATDFNFVSNTAANRW